MNNLENTSSFCESGFSLNTSPVVTLRKRRPPKWDQQLTTDIPALNEVQDFLNDDDLLEDEDFQGCPLPSTPVNPSLFNGEVVEAFKSSGVVVFGGEAKPAEDFIRKVWEPYWSVCNFCHLPPWLQDNEHLHNGHRPPLQSFSACTKSILRIHTETGNIWTHLLGCIAFVAILCVYLFTSGEELPLYEKFVLCIYFMSVIVCFGLSFLFHTFYCHSETVGKLFSKLDYCGIALLITGSFVPWLHFCFYCQENTKVIYVTLVVILGMTSIVVSLWDKFSESHLRPLRALVFAIFGLSGIVPAIHYVLLEGIHNAMKYACLGWLILMAFLYLLGAAIYTLRIPECFYPGMFDIWFQSHQIFHVLVIAGAFVHLHTITTMLTYRMTRGACAVQSAAMIF